MSDVYSKYQAVIGLEVHAQMLTKTKAFSADKNEYGAMPNSNISAISLGHPGTLPRLNKTQVEHAIKMGLACNSDIREYNKFARKNYFYLDLPKGYQISQFDTPICTGGAVTIDIDGKQKNINLTRIHLEEDSGKSLHELDPFNSLVDLNRAGVPLIEIVTEPDMQTAEEAYWFLMEVRKLVRHLEVCNGNMEEGSMRCDANISVMLKGASEFGQKVEVKNMNSMRNVQKAIEFEIKRQIDAIEAGEEIVQETRNFNALNGTTSTLRSKEDAHDYRYFTEPDLLPLFVSTNTLKNIKESMPQLPRALKEQYINEFGLSDYDAGLLSDDKDISNYYESILNHTNNYKAACNWLTGDIKSYLNNNGIEITDFSVPAKSIADLIGLIDSNQINYSIAAKELFPLMVKEPDTAPEVLAKNNQLILQSDVSSIELIIDKIIADNPDKAEAFKNGKKGLIGFFMGQLMKQTQGKADPKISNKLFSQKLNK